MVRRRGWLGRDGVVMRYAVGLDKSIEVRIVQLHLDTVWIHDYLNNILRDE